jgi:hypothetical protein
MNEIKVGDRLWNNERKFAIIVTEVTEHTVSYVDKTGKTRNVQRERIHFDGRERKKGYNYLSWPSRQVLDETSSNLLGSTALTSTVGVL